MYNFKYYFYRIIRFSQKHEDKEKSASSKYDKTVIRRNNATIIVPLNDIRCVFHDTYYNKNRYFLTIRTGSGIIRLDFYYAEKVSLAYGTAYDHHLVVFPYKI